jgi:hypothetical protein
MRKSEIFDSFVKIAQEKGMISNDSSDSKKKLEQTGRADSLDISAIEALYGTRPNTPKDMDYKNNIMEVAHPNSIILSPSYDKLNGLVENDMERQNIILNIVHKPTNGLHTQHKYAKKELLLSLIRIANNLDNNDQDELRTLADHCLLQVNGNQIKKTANPLAIAGIAAAAALLGGLYLKQHMRFISDGIQKDHQKLMLEIDDLLESNSNFDVGYQFKPEFLQMVQAFKGKLVDFYNVYSHVSPAIDELQKPRDAGELLQVAQSPETTNFIKAYQSFKVAIEKLLPMISKIQENFASDFYKQRQIAQTGALTSLVDSTLLHGGKGLVADDFDDVRHALDTYVVDIQNVAKALSSAETLKQKATNELQEAAYKSEELLGSNKPSQTSQPSQTVEDYDQEAQNEAQNLDKELVEQGILG